MNLFHENYEFKFQFIETKVLLSPVQEDNLYVHVLPVLVEEVLEEVGDGLVGDVAAHYNVPAKDSN